MTSNGTDHRLRIVAAVLTYQRPESLPTILRDLADQVLRLRDGRIGRVLVVDNHESPVSAEAVEAFAATTPARIDFVHEPTPGIAAARSRALREAGDEDLLAFIDDDESPSRDWLNNLVDTWEQHDHPVGVSGRVVPVFRSEPPLWVVEGRLFERARRETGELLRGASTANLLLDLKQVRSLGVDFDARLGLRGGSDTLFTMSLINRGGRIVGCADADVDDLVPEARMTWDWATQRAYSHGSSYGMVKMRLADGRPQRALWRIALVAGGLARVVVGAVRWAGGRLRGDLGRRVRGALFIRRGLGVIAAGVGREYVEYRRR